MTIDDDKSIYVGGLPYDYTEDSLRKVFDIYGAVVAVKINNDHDIGGKCYGFVTFTNPRSAIVAIEDMDGQKIGGRVVRVNEVRSRGGRSNFPRENVRRDPERHVEWGRGRGRERDHGRGPHGNGPHGHGHGHGHDQEREHYRGRNGDRPRDENAEFERVRDHDDRPSLGRDRERDLNEKPRNKMQHDREWGRERDIDLNRELEVDIMNNDEPMLKSRSGSHMIDRRSRELSLTSGDDYHDQVFEQVEVSKQQHGVIRKEISHIEENVKEKHQLILELKKKSQKLEDALASAKKLSSKRQRHLTTLQKTFLQVKDYSEKLRSSEQELQALIDTTMIEDDDGEDVEAENVALHTQGNA